jgi:hypothetical protein
LFESQNGYCPAIPWTISINIPATTKISGIGLIFRILWFSPHLPKAKATKSVQKKIEENAMCSQLLGQLLFIGFDYEGMDIRKIIVGKSVRTRGVNRSNQWVEGYA